MPLPIMERRRRIRARSAINLRSPQPASLSFNKGQWHNSNSSSSDGYVLSPTRSDPETIVIDTCGTDIYSAPTDELYNPREYRPPGPVERAYQTGRVLMEEIGATASRTASGVGREEFVAGWRTAWGAVRRRVVGGVSVFEQRSRRVRTASGTAEVKTETETETKGSETEGSETEGSETEGSEANGLSDEDMSQVMEWDLDSAILDEQQSEQQSEQKTPDVDFGYGEIASGVADNQVFLSLHSLSPHPSHHTASNERHPRRETFGSNITSNERRAFLVRMQHSEAYGRGDDF